MCTLQNPYMLRTYQPVLLIYGPHASSRASYVGQTAEVPGYGLNRSSRSSFYCPPQVDLTVSQRFD